MSVARLVRILPVLCLLLPAILPRCLADGKAAPADDATMERILREGHPVEIKDLATGITKPKRVTLEWEGRRYRAAFKTVDIENSDVTRFRTGFELHFTDRYAYERAAYLVDRMLGLNMVPVTVLRKLGGADGALIAWIEDAINEIERSEAEIGPDDPRELFCQQAVMRTFDALIGNDDRNWGNQLFTPVNWRLHLIDHSRSFRLERDLPEKYLEQPSSLPLWMLEALEGLDRDGLREGLEGTVTRRRIKSLLERRDQIVEKARRDVATYGEDFVFYEESCPPVTARRRR